jgi:hypothetical protein
MDITQNNDLTQLKAMAYDQLVIIEQSQSNLKTINARISELSTLPSVENSKDV